MDEEIYNIQDRITQYIRDTSEVNRISSLSLLKELKEYLGSDAYNTYVNNLHKSYSNEETQDDIINPYVTYDYIIPNQKQSNKFTYLNKYLKYISGQYWLSSLVNGYKPILELRYTILAKDIFDQLEDIIADNTKSKIENIMRVKHLYESIKRTHYNAKISHNNVGLYTFHYRDYFTRKHHSIFRNTLFMELLNYNKKRLYEEKKNREKILAISDVLENKNHYLIYTNSHFVLKKIISKMKDKYSKINVNLNDVKENLIKVVSTITNDELKRYIMCIIDDCKRSDLKRIGMYWGVKDMTGKNDEIRQRLKNQVCRDIKSVAKLPRDVLLNISDFSGF